ncbi:MAG TPA: hypothetical protein VF898_03650 [Chloroflexota bacterium]
MTKPPAGRRQGSQGREVSAEEAARLRELRNTQYESRLEAAQQESERPKVSRGKRSSAPEEAKAQDESQSRIDTESDDSTPVNGGQDAIGRSSAKRPSKERRGGSGAQRSRKSTTRTPKDQESAGSSHVSVVDRYLATPEDRPKGWARALRMEEGLFYADREVLDRSGDSLPWYRKNLGVVIDWLEAEGIASCKEATEADMKGFLEAVPSRESDQQDDLRGLDIAARIFFGLMVDEKIIAESPMTNLPRVTAKPGAFPLADSDAMRKALATAAGSVQQMRDTALLLCFADLQWTAEQFVQLTVADVDFVTGAVLARGPAWSGVAVGLLGHEALAVLKRHLGMPDYQPSTEQPLWLDDGGQPMTGPHVMRLLRRLGAIPKKKKKGRSKDRHDFTITVTITFSRGRR